MGVPVITQPGCRSAARYLDTERDTSRKNADKSASHQPVRRRQDKFRVGAVTDPSLDETGRYEGKDP